MCLRVCATLCGGCPRVDMVDEVTGIVRYRWQPAVPVRDVDSADLHELMRLLLLASAVNALEQEPPAGLRD